MNERRPLLNARLPGGERVNIVVPPACASIALTIRKFPSETMTLDQLERLGTLGIARQETGRDRHAGIPRPEHRQAAAGDAFLHCGACWRAWCGAGPR